MRNEEECVCSVCLQCAKLLRHGKIIKEMPGSLASGTSYILLFTKKKIENRAPMVADVTLHKQECVQRCTFAGRLQFSVGQWVI